MVLIAGGAPTSSLADPAARALLSLLTLKLLDKERRSHINDFTITRRVDCMPTCRR